MKIRIRQLTRLCLLAAALIFRGLSAAQETAPEEIGLRVGARAPAFTLKDQNGKEVALEALLKKGPVALVFYRSADWCMFCKFQWTHLQRNVKQFEATGGQVVGISYDSAKILKRFAEKQTITLPLLSDVGSKTIDAYGVRDKASGDPKSGVAVHATFVLDQQGVVRAKLLDVIYQEQPGVGFLLNALREARNSAGGTKQEDSAAAPSTKR
jgi:peroxiredoxin